MKLSFTMTPHADQPKHSTRFNFEKGQDITPDVADGKVFPKDLDPKFKPSFYIPKPYASNAKRIRVTIEVL